MLLEENYVEPIPYSNRVAFNLPFRDSAKIQPKCFAATFCCMLLKVRNDINESKFHFLS